MSPSTLIIMLIATACAAAAHLAWGRRWLQLVVFWMAALAGCMLVYVSGLHLPGNFPRPAGVPVVESVAAAWLLLLVAARLRL
ncbi:MAG: hypothetical protein H7Z42_03070 [Roseiflexaceae bacterium]|nr:hypothetical protein [Roseiflexaceae bacterium]